MFMNRVHEQCPKIDSGKISSRTGPKTGRVHRVHSPRLARAPSAQAARLLRTPRAPRAPLPVVRLCLPAARAPAARPAVGPACRAPRLSHALPSVRHARHAQPAPHARPAQRPCACLLVEHALARARLLPTPCACVAATMTVLWLGWALYCNTVQPSQPKSLQYNPHLSQYILSLPTCNTILCCN